MFTDDAHQAYRVGKVGECLRDESPNKHVLRGRLCHQWETTLRTAVEPVQAVLTLYPSIYDSAMISGDVVRVGQWVFDIYLPLNNETTHFFLLFRRVQ